MPPLFLYTFLYIVHKNLYSDYWQNAVERQLGTIYVISKEGTKRTTCMCAVGILAPLSTFAEKPEFLKLSPKLDTRNRHPLDIISNPVVADIYSLSSVSGSTAIMSHKLICAIASTVSVCLVLSICEAMYKMEGYKILQKKL